MKKKTELRSDTGNEEANDSIGEFQSGRATNKQQELWFVLKQR